MNAASVVQLSPRNPVRHLNMSTVNELTDWQSFISYRQFTVSCSLDDGRSQREVTVAQGREHAGISFPSQVARIHLFSKPNLRGSHSKHAFMSHVLHIYIHKTFRGWHTYCIFRKTGISSEFTLNLSADRINERKTEQYGKRQRAERMRGWWREAGWRAEWQEVEAQRGSGWVHLRATEGGRGGYYWLVVLGGSYYYKHSLKAVQRFNKNMPLSQ